MRNKKYPIKYITENSVAYYALLILTGFLLYGCASTKKNKEKTIPSNSDQNNSQAQSGTSYTTWVLKNYGFDDHKLIHLKPDLPTSNESLPVAVIDTVENDEPAADSFEIRSPVAEKLVDNYLKSEIKEPKGHCLSVSKGRFEQAYKEVHGHPVYQDLPDSMATKKFTAKQVFNLLYVSASETEQGWRSLPERYRGKGNAGAIAYAGMGTLVDAIGVWGGQLRPGALMQVWRFKDDYEQVVQGVDVKELDPYGHSFIFIGYVRNEKNEITGLEIADQGFQSYRPLRPSDYEVWWGVNLTI